MTLPEDDPSVVTALRYDVPAVAHELAAWCNGNLEEAADDGVPPTVWVPTEKGPRPAALGDWIVRRPAGDFYTCDAAEFAALHDPLV